LEDWGGAKILPWGQFRLKLTLKIAWGQFWGGGQFFKKNLPKKGRRLKKPEKTEKIGKKFREKNCPRAKSQFLVLKIAPGQSKIELKGGNCPFAPPPLSPPLPPVNFV
jgi:hypothetical protein